ncbi:nitroreductase family deazaflavin-dependent oxidoreductase [Mycobacterium dioxanotrophicus]|uniref:Nitroreductase family deazaflavin-dependent oxidoreductase n=2 Tax=Mycobacterium dioxanotrophicus TaxID=482462 RepID=A0A1Y0CET8_9MYCO|nr:nitroreductase family deazaflavin-dependent oxidoreductase [Mycobacterium dioxanotrophicus]ART73486.1 nitroreductase family deazaflavin-dependent oxidoreductase [Mycobacterium dioxanotrophicus]
MRALARFNKYVTNPIQRMWAPYLPYMAVIEHVDRKSGTSYRTPVMAFVDNSAITVVLNYGAQSDWVRNVQAGEAGVIQRGKHYRLADPRVITLDSPDLPRAVQGINTSAHSALHGRLAAD